MYYAAEDLGYVESGVSGARRHLAEQISSGIGSLIKYLRS
jgi:hypothetical protein